MPTPSKSTKTASKKTAKPKTKNSDSTPKTLRPYICHGIDLTWGDHSEHAQGDCPFCGDEKGKFRVVVDTGQARCLACGVGSAKGGMNTITFLRHIYKESQEVDPHLFKLSRNKMIEEETLEQWGTLRSMIDGRWIFPGHNQDGKLCQLYIYKKMGDKMRLVPTTGLPHQMGGVPMFDYQKQYIFLTEGFLDGMKLWEVLNKMVLDGETEVIRLRKKGEQPLSEIANVLSVPGTNVFNEHWCTLFRNKTVHICFDNGWPKKNKQTGKLGRPAALEGMKRVAGILSQVTQDINYLRWGDKGYNKELLDDCDIRDIFTLTDEGLKASA